MNWDLILTVLALLIMVIILAPIVVIMMLSYQKAKLTMIAEMVNKHHMQFHPSSDEFNKDDFDWSIFEGGAK